MKREESGGSGFLRYYHKVWLVMLFGWLMLYSNRMVLSSCLPLIMDEFGLSYAMGGLLFTAYFYLYMGMQFPAGLLGDRFGRKRMLTIGTFLWSIIAFITSLSRSLMELFVYRALLGLTQGTYFGNDRSIVAASTPKEKRGLGQAVSLTGMGFGMAIGMIGGGYLAQVMSWRTAIAIIAIPAFFVGFLIFKIIKESGGKGTETSSTLRESYGQAVKSKILWVLYLIHALIMYPYWVLGTWTPKVFLEIGVKQLSEASIYSSLLGFSAIPGLILLGSLSDRFEKSGYGRRILISLSFIPLSASVLLLAYMITTQTYLIAAILVFISGMFIWGLFAVLYSFIADITPSKIYGSVFGLLNAIGFLSSLIAPPITGAIRDITGSFAWGFYIAGFLAIMGCILTFMVKAPNLQSR